MSKSVIENGLNDRLDEMALDMIRFLKKWGLWRDATILTNGHMYSYGKKDSDAFDGIENVNYACDVNHVEYTRGLVERPDGSKEWESLANPEHHFDLIYEGPLGTLLNYHLYEPDIKGVSEEGWEAIFGETDILQDYIASQLEVSSVQELGRKMWLDIFDNSEISVWDPLEYDTYDEYLELTYGDYDEADKMTATSMFETYDEYKSAREYGVDYFNDYYTDDVQVKWEDEIMKARLFFMKNDCRWWYGSLGIQDYFNQVAWIVKREFDGIFEKYDFWYELDFESSLSCYRL